jgi:DNA-3-methyladenine glycosylase I
MPYNLSNAASLIMILQFPRLEEYCRFTIIANYNQPNRNRNIHRCFTNTENDLKEKIRCGWSITDPIYIKYHDEEWGVPVHDDRKLFEFLILEGFQAGLSWITILRKRENFRKAFNNFDPEKVAVYGKRKINSLLKDEGIIRNNLKVAAAVTNARAFLKVQEEFGSFDKYIWQFVNYKPVRNKFKSLNEVPASTEISDIMSKDLKKRGFKFVGTTICYAHMQATGMVNDHIITCWKY